MRTGREHVAVVSCHVERPLDDRIWLRLRRLLEARPGGFAVAAFVRPPDADERGDVWLERVRSLGGVVLGHHPHFGSVTHARADAPGPAVETVRREAAWLADAGIAPRYFSAGGWYAAPELAETVRALGYVDCSATAFGLDPRYLVPGSVRIALDRPAVLAVDGGDLLEIPATHSLGMLVRALASPLGRLPFVHVHFHDWELLDVRRRLALEGALALLARRASPRTLDQVAAAGGPRLPLSAALVDAALGSPPPLDQRTAA